MIERRTPCIAQVHYVNQPFIHAAGQSLSDKGGSLRGFLGDAGKAFDLVYGGEA
jgi:hypothetical protein